MSAIEWTDLTRNAIVGCDQISEGCANCFAIGVAGRQMSPQHQGLTTKPSLPVLDKDGSPVLDEDGEPKTKEGKQTWSGVVRMVPSVLGERIPRPRGGGRRRVFVNSMSDWFHPEMLATEERRRYLAACFAWMYSQPWCDFQLLTKRPEGLRTWLKWLFECFLGGRRKGSGVAIPASATLLGPIGDFFVDIAWWSGVARLREHAREQLLGARFDPESADNWREVDEITWPPKNVIFGVTAENQRRADERLPVMAELKRLGLISKVFVSYEPALGPVDFSPWLGDTIDWLICGAESGNRARPMHPRWARAARDQALASRTPFLFKQWGSWQSVAEDDAGWTHVVSTGGRATLRGQAAPLSDWVGGAFMRRANKKAAGSELDGRRWLEFPVLVGDATTAYTIGRAENYDRVLGDGDGPVRKTGKGDLGNSDPEYPGGIVWQTAEEATAAAPDGFAAYELELPGPWRECVYEVGGHHLMPEARIVRRVP